MPEPLPPLLVHVTNDHRADRALALRDQELISLHEMSQALQECPNADEAYSVIAQWAPRLFGGRSGALFAMTSPRNLMERVAVWGQPRLGRMVFGPDECWALQGCRPHSVREPGSRIQCKHLTEPLDDGALCVPVTVRRQPIGMLHLQGPIPAPPAGASPDSPADPQQDLAVAVADHIALALANLETRQILRFESIRDPLTQLFNRQYMEASLEREIQRAVRGSIPVGMIMLQLDEVQAEAFPEHVHEKLLEELAQILGTRVRAEDIACRYGEEVFALILPGAPLEVILPRAEQIREEARHLLTELSDGTPLPPLTVSLGVAAFPQHGQSSLELVTAAARALSRAQQDGRNRVVVAGGKP